MTHDIRWSIDELKARYQLEPELLDVFVEGSFDREVLSQRSDRGRTYYEIDVVDVPSEIVHRFGLSLGNKQRVIALSQALDELPANARVSFLVDRDLDHWFNGLTQGPRLWWTVFCCVEGHFLTKEAVHDIAIITARARVPQFDKLYDSLGETLRQLYALRLADRELALNVQWTALRKYWSLEHCAVRFDVGRYVDALLNSNAAVHRKVEFNECMNRWLSQLSCDLRLSFRGHDYVELLAWAISQLGGLKEFSTPAAIERLFVLLARSTPSLNEELQ